MWDRVFGGLGLPGRRRSGDDEGRAEVSTDRSVEDDRLACARVSGYPELTDDIRGRLPWPGVEAGRPERAPSYGC